MNWSCLSGRYPEIGHLPRHDQSQLVRAAQARLPKHVRRLFIAWLGPCSATWLAVSQYADEQDKHTLAVAVNLCYFGFTAAFVAYSYGRTRRALRSLLCERGITPARCWDCGYDLTGNVSGTCPECGRPVPGGSNV